MTIASRTPEGLPHRCPVCGRIAQIETSLPGGDSCCPSCGQLLWWFRDRLSAKVGVDSEQVALSTAFNTLGDDSLDTVELVMELEEEFDVTIPDDVAERIRTVEEAIRYVEQNRRRETPE